MEAKGYIGVDFGTTNSHFAYARLEQDPPQAVAVTLGDSQGGSLSSCVLWRSPGRTEEDFFLYGDKAIEEWAMLEPNEQKAYRFSAGFKPDLVSLEQARLDAWSFLRQAYLEMRKTRQPPAIGDENGMPVVIGVPAEIGEAHQTITKEIAAKAGFGSVTCLAEPVGALTYHLAHGQISEEEARKGVVVVDFGGGTLDVALLDQDGVRKPWGNPLLGGRLFDDLFFQWVLQANDVKIDDWAPDDLMYGWHVASRKLKENFSRHWKARGTDERFKDFKGRIVVSGEQTLGVLRNASLDEFEERARAYRPSGVARDYFNRLGSDLRHFGTSGPVDLFDMIRGAIANGPELRQGRDFAVVILTGGSSSWPFMGPMISDLFRVAADAILVAAAPERTVGEGLAIFNVVRHKHRHARQAISADLQGLKEGIHHAVEEATESAARELVSTIASQVMEAAGFCYREWRENGGVLSEVESRVKEDCAKVPINALFQDKVNRLSYELMDIATKVTLNWLDRHGIKGAVIQFDAVNSAPARPVALPVSFEVGGTVGARITAIASWISGIVAATIAGGSGIALIATGPAGLVIGAVLGVAAIYMGKKQITEKVSNYDFQGGYLQALQVVFSAEKLEAALRQGEQKLVNDIGSKLIEQVNAYRPQFERLADAAAEDALRRFGILERLS